MNSTSNPALEIRRLDFHHEVEDEAPAQFLYSDFNLRVETGTAVALMGESGIGKSTLAKLLARLIVPNGGEIFWSQSCAKRAEALYVEQQSLDNIHPWRTLRGNLLWIMQQRGVSKGDADHRSVELLRAFKLDHRIDALPRETSGGELQRLVLAFSLAWNPRCLILDEPFSALDRELKHRVLQSVREIAIRQGMTIMFITHNLTDSLALADRCVILGERPVRIIGDVPVLLSFPRDEDSAPYRATQDRLIEILRHGYF